MLSDGEFYTDHQSMQLYDTQLFLESVIPKIDSSSQDQNIMMDLGCGPGNTCVKMLLPAFSRVRKMIGVDLSEHMIELAKKNNAHDKIEYHVADIEDSNPSSKAATMLFAEFYSENQSMQLYDAKLFLESIIPKLDMSSQNQDVMMDIGCGPGKTCVKMLLSAFPAVKKIIGVDVSEDMIEFAKKNNAHEKIEYHVADIENRNKILKWSQQISKVTSILCFHWLENQKEAFENVYYLLKAGGEAALVFVLTSAVWESYQLHYSNPKYKKFLENKRSYIPESHFKKYDSAFYRNLLKGIGFEVVVCEEEKRSYTFPNDDVCRDALYSLCGLTNYIPDELRPEFKEDTFENFLLKNGCSDDGKHTLHYKTLTLVIRKP